MNRPKNGGTTFWDIQEGPMYQLVLGFCQLVFAGINFFIQNQGAFGPVKVNFGSQNVDELAHKWRNNTETSKEFTCTG